MGKRRNKGEGKRRGKGEGGIRQREDGRWEGSVTIGVTEKGNPKRVFCYGKTREEAAEKLAELLVAHHKGMLVQPDTVTVKEWLERWLEGKTHIATKTRVSYQQMFCHVNGSIGDVRVQSLKPAQIRSLYVTLAKKGWLTEPSVTAQCS